MVGRLFVTGAGSFIGHHLAAKGFWIRGVGSLNPPKLRRRAFDNTSSLPFRLIVRSNGIRL